MRRERNVAKPKVSVAEHRSDMNERETAGPCVRVEGDRSGGRSGFWFSSASMPGRTMSFLMSHGGCGDAHTRAHIRDLDIRARIR